MTEPTRSPGVSRPDRRADERLQRLDKQLADGVGVSVPVLAQWIRRYGEPAREIIRRHGQYCDELDAVEQEAGRSTILPEDCAPARPL